MRFINTNNIKCGFSIVILLFLVACSIDNSGTSGIQKQPDIASKTSETGVSKADASCILEIVAHQGADDSIFIAVPKNFNPAEGQIEWLINGVSVPGTTSAQFTATGAKKGDVVQACAKTSGVKIVSNSVEIKNKPPGIISGRFMPELFKQGEALYIDVAAQDADGDTISFTYEWTCNGQSAGRDRQISVPLKRGDKISVTATPFDGEHYGKPAIFEKEILNMPPVISEHREISFNGKVYTYQVKALDPDGDPLLYSIKAAADAVSIDPGTGLIQWNVPNGFAGTVPVTVTVTDGHDGSANADFKLTVK
jgi:hypothetical protein